jgi:phage gp36-like protein
MPFITTDELETHIYGENSDIISREDDAIPQAAVDGAIAEAKSYLKKYDVATVFAKTGANRNALLLIFVKDIAVWHFIQLGNPGIDIELRKTRYKAAIAWLIGVQKGDINPDLPEADDDTYASGAIQFGSNTKREQHF